MLIGAGGTRDAEDEQAEPVVLQHSARTGMMSAKVSPSATVMNFVTERTTAGERKGTDRGGPASCTEITDVQNFAQCCELSIDWLLRTRTATSHLRIQLPRLSLAGN